MSRRYVLGLLAAIVLTGCSVSPSDALKTDIEHSKLLCEYNLKKQLRDPESAVFSDEVVIGKPSPDSNSWMVDGLVRAKNGFGGYADMQLWTCSVNNRGNDLTAHAQLLKPEGN